MGEPKQLLRIGSRTLLRRTVEEALASSVRETFVVLGAHAERLRDELHDLAVTTIDNPRHEEGIGTSVSLGVQHIARTQPPCDAVVLLTCDQPYVSAATIDRLLAEWKTSGKPIVAAAYGNTIGVPAVFARRYFDVLVQLPADSGAKPVLLRHRSDVAVVDFEPGAVDLDTPADYERFLRDGVTS